MKKMIRGHLKQDRIYYILLIVFFLIFGLLLSAINGRTSGLAFGNTIMISIIILGMVEGKFANSNKTDALLLSSFYTRKELMIRKYISIFIYYIFTMTGLIISMYYQYKTGDYSEYLIFENKELFFIVLSIPLFIVGIIIPILISIKNDNQIISRIIGLFPIILLLGTFIFKENLFNKLIFNPERSFIDNIININNIGIIIFIVAIVFYILSFLLSNYIYNKKDII